MSILDCRVESAAWKAEVNAAPFAVNADATDELKAESAAMYAEDCADKPAAKALAADPDNEVMLDCNVLSLANLVAASLSMLP